MIYYNNTTKEALRSHIKNSCFGFHQGFQTPRNNKSTRPKRPRDFICFSVFGTPDETLALVVDILRQKSWFSGNGNVLRAVTNQKKWSQNTKTKQIKI